MGAIGLDKLRLTLKQHRWRASPLATAPPVGSSDFSLVPKRKPRATQPNLRQPNSAPVERAPHTKRGGVEVLCRPKPQFPFLGRVLWGCVPDARRARPPVAPCSPSEGCWRGGGCLSLGETLGGPSWPFWGPAARCGCSRGSCVRRGPWWWLVFLRIADPLAVVVASSRGWWLTLFRVRTILIPVLKALAGVPAAECWALGLMKICYRSGLTPPPQNLHPWRTRARNWELFSTRGERANNHHHQANDQHHRTDDGKRR